MNDLSYLIFKLNHTRYGIPTTVVQEIFFIPEITPLVETPKDLLGVIDLRGEILPIVSLHQKLGQPVPPCQLKDSVIVVQWRHERVGVVVNQVEEVREITPDQLKTDFADYTRSETHPDALVLGVASLDDALITLLNPKRLLANFDPSTHFDSATTLLSADSQPSAFDSDWLVGLSTDAQQILRSRSQNLKLTLTNQDLDGLLPLAVVGLADEYFGIPLNMVDEFTEIRKLTPIPCCPQHILGNMNLRGEVVTVIDISQLLNLFSPSEVPKQKAIVVRLNELSVGIAVDEIFDVAYITSTQIAKAPISIHATHDEYLQGVSPYRESMMSVINLPKVIMADSLIVNEDV